MHIDHDGHWKYLIFRWFKQFVAFFAPQLYDKIDFTKPVEFLDKELDKIIKDESKKGNKRCDALVKAFFKNGETKWLLIHIEIQHGYDKHFAKRMFTYYCRIWDRFGQEIEPLAIFTSAELPPKPRNAHISTGVLRKLTYEYGIYKVKDQNNEASEKVLQESDNPFALVVLACLYVMKTKVLSHQKETPKEQQKQAERLAFKMKLIRLLWEKGYDRQTIEDLFSFIKHIVHLPKELEVTFAKTVQEEYVNHKSMKRLITEEDKAMFDQIAKNYTEIMVELAQEKAKKELDIAQEKARKKLDLVQEKAKKELDEVLRVKEEEMKLLLEKKEKEKKEAQLILEKEKEQTILNLYKVANFTVHQIAVIVQRDENYVSMVLKKHTK